MLPAEIIQLLSASFEFFKEYNKEVALRPTDNYEVPEVRKLVMNPSWTKSSTLQLLKLLPEKVLDKKKQNTIYQAPFSVKARALLYAHLYRLHQQLNPNTLLFGTIGLVCVLL